MKPLSILLGALLGLYGWADAKADSAWRAKLHQQLPLLGHRNWIVVADSAYPWQTAPGVETVDTGSDQLEVVRAVMTELGRMKHVRPIVYTDAELPFVAEHAAPGVTAYRDALKGVLARHEAASLPHEQIIGKLDEAGKTFHVLVLKTRLTIPYTSVFLQLDCGYWNAESERELRRIMGAASPARR